MDRKSARCRHRCAAEDCRGDPGGQAEVNEDRDFGTLNLDSKGCVLSSSARPSRPRKPNSSHFPAPPDLEAAVALLLRQVPAGRMTTFGGLATALGEVRAARWLATDWLDICQRQGLPGHRVVLKDGR